MKTTWGGGPDRASARLFTEVTERPLTKPGRDAASWAAAAIAIVVHLFVIALVALGVLIVVRADSTFPLIPIIVGTALVGLAVLMRPRVGRPPKIEDTVDPAAAPTLYALVNQVAERLGSKPVWRIMLTADYSASFGIYGLRRRAVLTLGYPLWNLLEPQERVALLGHELGHAVNGDSQRGLLVGSSLGSLGELRAALLIGPSSTGHVMTIIGSALSRIFLAVAALPVFGMGLVQERLLARSSQRAEYFADHLAATIAGVTHTTSMLDKLRLSRGAMIALRAALLRKENDIWAVERAWRDARTAEDKARTIAADDAKPHTVDATHPRTALRIAALRARAYGGDTLVSGRADAEATDRELAPLLRDVIDGLRSQSH